MLTRFEVKNFKNFKDNFVLDFTKTKNYNFNPECVKDGVVNKAIIYGPNGIGKSNLGFAIFDIVSHLTDKNRNLEFYGNYLNAENKNETAQFIYNFKFLDNTITYTYKKRSLEELVSEELLINDKPVASFDRTKSDPAFIDLKGAETLNRDLGQNKVSIIKYISSSTVLEETDENLSFKEFVKFVERMLYFRSIGQNCYIGYETGANSISKDILEKGLMKDFETFLNKAQIKCKLKEIEINGQKSIAFDFGKKSVEFFSIASTGTQSLSLLYYWLQRMKIKNEVSFVFIDEFDAYYHHELSKLVVEEMKKGNYQTVLTTHNTSIMSNDILRPDCYFIMSKNDIKPLYDFTDKELRLAHNIEKMYRAGAFDG